MHSATALSRFRAPVWVLRRRACARLTVRRLEWYSTALRPSMALAFRQTSAAVQVDSSSDHWASATSPLFSSLLWSRRLTMTKSACASDLRTSSTSSTCVLSSLRGRAPLAATMHCGLSLRLLRRSRQRARFDVTRSPTLPSSALAPRLSPRRTAMSPARCCRPLPMPSPTRVSR